jgi:hypothetical protein
LTHWTEGWVGPRADMDVIEKKISCPCQESKPDSSVIQTIAYSTDLHYLFTRIFRIKSIRKLFWLKQQRSLKLIPIGINKQTLSSFHSCCTARCWLLVRHPSLCDQPHSLEAPRMGLIELFHDIISYRFIDINSHPCYHLIFSLVCQKASPQTLKTSIVYYIEPSIGDRLSTCRERSAWFKPSLPILCKWASLCTSNARDVYSWNARLKYRPAHRLSWLVCRGFALSFLANSLICLD